MRQLPVSRRVELCLPFLEAAGLVSSPPDDGTHEKVAAIVEAAGDRITAAGDVIDYADFFTADDELPYDEKAFDKRLRKPPEAAELLAGFRDRLASADRFDAATLEDLLRSYVEEKDVKLGQVIHALRVAVTGKPVGFGMFEILEVLGREHCLTRIDRALAYLGEE
jgi:glutamyl-tRNA synthetase